jgi:hypothetical protein
MLLAHFVEDRTLPGEPFHQTRMRRVLLRLLRRAEPMLWQDVAILPFLARNAYLTQLEAQADRGVLRGAVPGRRLHADRVAAADVLEPADLGEEAPVPARPRRHRHAPGRVSALRLSRLGAELLDAEPAGKVGGTRSSVIVQPDFEMLVFPGDDVHDVVHLFDRFARRTKSDHVHQFRIDQAERSRGHRRRPMTGPRSCRN